MLRMVTEEAVFREAFRLPTTHSSISKRWLSLLLSEALYFTRSGEVCFIKTLAHTDLKTHKSSNRNLIKPGFKTDNKVGFFSVHYSNSDVNLAAFLSMWCWQSLAARCSSVCVHVCVCVCVFSCFYLVTYLICNTTAHLFRAEPLKEESENVENIALCSGELCHRTALLSMCEESTNFS